MGILCFKVNKVTHVYDRSLHVVLLIICVWIDRNGLCIKPIIINVTIASQLLNSVLYNGMITISTITIIIEYTNIRMYTYI